MLLEQRVLLEGVCSAACKEECDTNGAVQLTFQCYFGTLFCIDLH